MLVIFDRSNEVKRSENKHTYILIYVEKKKCCVVDIRNMLSRKIKQKMFTVFTMRFSKCFRIRTQAGQIHIVQLLSHILVYSLVFAICCKK